MKTKSHFERIKLISLYEITLLMQSSLYLIFKNTLLRNHENNLLNNPKTQNYQDLLSCPLNLNLKDNYTKQDSLKNWCNKNLMNKNSKISNLNGSIWDYLIWDLDKVITLLTKNNKFYSWKCFKSKFKENLTLILQEIISLMKRLLRLLKTQSSRKSSSLRIETILRTSWWIQ